MLAEVHRVVEFLKNYKLSTLLSTLSDVAFEFLECLFRSSAAPFLL